MRTATRRASLINWCSVTAVMMGIFAIVTTEILPIGLLTTIATSYGISEGTAGLLMTVPGIVAAIAAPAVTVAAGKRDRRLMLCLLIALLAAANFIAAIAPDYWVLLASRVLVGVTIGGFWSLGAGLAPRLVPAKATGTATAVIFAAVPLGSVLGVPAGTFIGDLAGWRASFVVLGVLSVGVLVALTALLPPLPAEQARLTGLLRRRGVRVSLLATVLIVAAHFGTYTYVTPFLEQVTHIDTSTVSSFLLVYGAAGVVGNFLAGPALTRNVRATFAVSAGLLALATLALTVIGSWGPGALALLILWGIAYGAVPACSQALFANAAPDAREAATVLFTSSFQATIAIGAFTGGLVVDLISLPAVLVFGAVLAALAAIYQA